jgi:hypothetical protein
MGSLREQASSWAPPSRLHDNRVTVQFSLSTPSCDDEEEDVVAAKEGQEKGTVHLEGKNLIQVKMESR